MNLNKKNLMIRITFLIPALFFFSVFVIFPFLQSIYYSFTDWDGISKPLFIGLKNFYRLFSDNSFIEAIKNTLIFCITSLLIGNPLSLLLALFLNRKIRGIGILRTIFYLPAVISLMVVSLTWSIILNYDGVINYFLKTIGLGGLMQDWISNIGTSLASLIFIMMWGGIGVGAVYYLAGLQSIPQEINESAAVDGATGWSKFKFITLPLLMPSITIVTFLNLVGSLKTFDLPFIMTNGGGGTTSTIALKVYQFAFANNNFGYSTAGGLILFIFVSLVSFLQVKYTRSREVEY